MASSKSPGDRPSFSAFLKKTKDKVRGIRRDESASPQGRGKAIAVSSECKSKRAGSFMSWPVRLWSLDVSGFV